VKFTNKGGIVKSAATIKEVPTGVSNGEHSDSITIIFEVKDSGIGMTPEQLNKIYEPFMQAETGTTRKYGGTGLGLPISKNIIEMMGGKLKVESTPGVGSKFSFELTFNTVETGNAAPGKTITGIDNAIEMPQFAGETLLCEDNQMNQQVLCEHLERVGLKADVAENGREGFNMVKRRQAKGEKPDDLIFMDIHMPVMDGIEAATLINELNTGTPIVAMTANVMSHDREQYLKIGMKDCVGKPFRAQELWRCLLKYLVPMEWKVEDEVEKNQNEEKMRNTLIARFVKDNQDKYVKISEAIETGDIKLANRLAHTLKSNAGLLDKTALQKAAEEVERSLEDGKNHVTSEQLNRLETELQTVLDELGPLAKETEGQQAPVEKLDKEKARELFAELKPLLERGSPECMKHVDALRRIPGSGEALVQKLIQQINDLDFVQALETFDKLTK
jgi:CheY-like chemotaxis protein